MKGIVKSGRIHGKKVKAMRIFDSHVHCGIQDKYPPQAFEDYLLAIRGSPIQGAAMFPPVLEIYERNDPFFTDTPSWRRRRQAANEYLLTLQDRDIEVFPYLFLWNDFAVRQITPWHFGIKWHRHENEPRYNYDDPACTAAIATIREKNLPVVLEEELANTIRFVNETTPGIRVILPHMGMLNGGYRRIVSEGLWEKPDVWADTALALPSEIMHYIEHYGHERLLFGSDFPFGHPSAELAKINRLKVSDDIKADILANNLMRLYEKIRPVL